MRDIVSPLSGFGSPFGQRRRDTPAPAFDPDALAYITAVETADGEALEAGVREAINSFVVGCKADGIWDALKASCILAGARTLNGALVPLVGDAPTNFNFVSEDYNRKTGLKGDGSTKHLGSNYFASSHDQSNFHMVACIENVGSGFQRYISAGPHLEIMRASTAEFFAKSNATTIQTHPVGDLPGLVGISRAGPTEYNWIGSSESGTQELDVDTTVNGEYLIFRRNDTSANYYVSRISFYGLGEALDLAALDTRVSNLMTALDGAIT